MKKNIKFGKSKKESCEPYLGNAQLDISKGLTGVLYQVGLVTSKSGDALPKEKILSHINNAVKYIIKYIKKKKNIQDSYINIETDIQIIENWDDYYIKEKYFFLFRCLLLHKHKEVRVAGLRLHRYLINNEKDVEALIKCNTVPIIVRCIDLCLDNHAERVHGIRLAHHLMQAAPALFPVGLARCLVAVSREGSKARDRLLRAAQALLCDLAILNPRVFIDCGGVSCCLYSILDCSMARINEALLSTILFLLNDPQWRNACSQFYMIAAPFSDIHYKHYDNDVECYNKMEERDLRIRSSCLAMLAALRSWPGCITLCQPRDVTLKALMDLLLSPLESTRVVILDFLYDLLRVPLGECYSDYEEALKERSTILSLDADAWKLHEGFVVAEAKSLLPHIAKFRPNLIQNYCSLLLYILMKDGLFASLCTVIVSSSQHVSVKATILLGELLDQADLNIPDCGTLFHALPLLSEVASGTDAERRVRASQAITALLQMSRNKFSKKENKNMSLYLTCILRSAKVASGNEKDHSKTTKWLSRDHDDLIQQTLKDTFMITESTSCSEWKWEKVLPVLLWPSNSLLLLDDAIYKTFLMKLLIYFKPSSKQFSVLPVVHQTSKIQAEILLAFCQFLLRISQDDQEKYLWSLLVDISFELKALVCERPSHDCILSPSNLNTTMGQYYFLAIGSLTKSSVGYEMVVKSTIFDQLLLVVEKSYSDIYAKLIVTTLDYVIDGLNRVILTKILTKGKECIRLYATQLLRVFIRAHSPGFTHWGVKLLVEQLYDESQLVAMAALDILDEALDEEEYVEAVLKDPPSVEHLGDKGQLLLAKMLAFPKGFQNYQDPNFIISLLDQWSESFNLKYVKLMQIALGESLTQLQRGEDGMYGRRTGSKHVVHDVYLLPHLYGSLTLHKEGYSILIQHKSVANLVQILREGHVANMQEVSKLKAAIWAMGHLGRSTQGVNFLVSQGVILSLTHLAASCQIYSVRGTVFNALCCIAVTWDGVNELQKHGWESVKRHHHEMVQLVMKETTNITKEGNPSMKTKFYDISEYDFDDQEAKAGFYLPDESEDEVESSLSLLLDDLYEGEVTPRKSQTLPHDSRPPPYIGHQRSFSDCAPVIEELNGSMYAIPSSEINNFSKKGSYLKTKILSSFRRRSSKRRDSTGSRTSNASSTSEKMFSFLKQTKRKRGRNSENGGEASSTDICNPLSLSYTDQGVSDEDTIKLDESLKLIRGSSPCDNRTPSSSPMPFISISSPPTSAATNINYSFHKQRIFTVHRRGISESSHDELQSKNSLRDFLSSSLDQTTYNFRNLLDVRNMGRSPSGCSELSLIRSSGTLGQRGGSSNWLFVKSGAVATHQDEIAPGLHPSGQCYLGLTLPLDLNMLLYDSTYNKERKNLDIVSKDSFPILSESEFILKDSKKLDKKSKEVTESAFEFHSRETCISCCSFNRHNQEKHGMVEEVNDDQETRVSALPSINEIGSDDHQLSNDTCQSIDANPESKKLPNRLLVRKEILKFVSNLSNSFIAKSSESGLLALKHRLSWGFQDPCLYSEIYVLLSSYSYRLNARRFIQELFLDISFKQVFEVSKQINAENIKLYQNLIDLKDDSVLSGSNKPDYDNIPEYNLNDFAGFDMQGDF